MRTKHSLFSGALVLAACSTGLAWAQAQPAEQALPCCADAVSEAQLEGLRGGFDLVKNDMRLNSDVTGNSALNVQSGSNSIADGAFANASGLPMVVQNSGSNVSIQNATIVNVQFK